MLFTKIDEIPCGVVEISGKLSKLVIQQLLIDALENVNANKLKLVLLDASKMEVVFPLSLHWYRNSWIPMVKKSYVKVIAVLVHHHFTTPKFLDELNSEKPIDLPIKMRFFTDKKTAIDWLKSIKSAV